MSEYIKKEDALKMIEQNRDQICIYRAVEALQPYSFPDREKGTQEISIVVREKGEWRPIYQGDEIIDYRCTNCDFGSTFGKSTYNMHFCPNCGADMRGGKE